MAIKDTLPVSYLLFTNKGRITRLTFWTSQVFIWSAFYILFNLLNYSISYSATWAIYPLLFWALIATFSKRLHDTNLHSYWLLLGGIPIAGPLVLLYLLGVKKGSIGHNKFGANPKLAPDYFKNPDAQNIEHLKTAERIVDDVTQLNPIIVSEVKAPKSIDELQKIVKETDKTISIGGGRFSMGGQTASTNSLHIDMRQLNQVISFSKDEKTIHVQAGIRWCDIQHYIDQHDLSVKIMQTYANFTVGGSLSVNCHGRYIGLGPIILSVNAIELILANGDLIRATREENADLFNASIGCYNAIGIIASVEFQLEDNIAIERVHKIVARDEYHSFFLKDIRNNKDVVFHNGDLYPPKYERVRAVSWVKTNKKPTVKTRLMPLAASYPLERYFIGAFSYSKFGKWRREFIYDPILYLKSKVHWRNYEAGYDVAELEPKSRKKNSFVLLEYFVPVNQFDAYSIAMAEIFNRHNANIVNVSIRHALKDSCSLLAWAREEVYAFVIWYKQGTSEEEKRQVAVWTRELIDAVIKVNGAYYLPYQAHATEEQFHKAFPNAQKLIDLKNKIDPDFKFRNVIWDTYHKPNKK
mgnify:CR=1 FL=1